MPWLHRELLCVNSDQLGSMGYVVHRIENLIQTYDMTSPEFRSHIQVVVPNHTDHFIHELINFARSAYDLIGYDRFVTYLPRFERDTNDVVTLSSSDESSDVEFVEFVGPVVDEDTSVVITNVAATNQNASSNDPDNRSNRNDSIEQAGASTSGTVMNATTPSQAIEQMVSAPNLSGDDSDEEEIKNYLRHKPSVSTEEMIRGRTGPTPPITNAESTPSNSINNKNNINSNSKEKSDADSDRTIIVSPNNVQANDGASTSTSQALIVPQIVPKVEPNTHTKPMPEIIDADSGSDSDECLFVCAKKPPHLRTPEYVELNSDSDSDVVFVPSETCQTPLTEIASIEAANKVRESILKLQNQLCETSTNLKQKRGRDATDTNATTTYTNHTASSSMYEAKPSTSAAMLQWLRRISPRCK